MNPFTAKADLPGLISKRDRAREQLFEAGWHPSMAGMPVDDDRISAALLKLNAANVAVTMKKLRRR